MKTTLIACFALSLSATAFAGSAAPGAEPAAKTAQQNKMTTCNADAAGKKGDERKVFMKTCLSAKPAAAPEKPMTAQQTKMKTCNADAAGKKGDERKAFMKTCLSAK
ncbi:MAG: PsiF family protein [Massilia sp.]